GDGQVELNWDALLDIDYYNIYKNDELLDNTTNEFYVDEEVENFTTYTYYVTAIYTETGDESNPSNVVTVTPLPPMSMPFFDDFETGALYWNFESTWGLSSSQSYSPSHSITESPTGDYGNDMEISATLYNFSLEYAEEADLSFWTKYFLEANYDYTYLQISTDGINWTTLETFNGNQNSWIQKTYSLDAYLGETNVLIRFKFESDVYVTEDGMYIDDLVLNVVGTGTGIVNPVKSDIIHVYPNPFAGSTVISLSDLSSAQVEISIYNGSGTLITKDTETISTDGNYSYEFHANGLPEGIYYFVLRNGNNTFVEKMIIVK
ncbi:MAG: T9SS type A sorting domain-containing protein, partial [Bacteroidales bacterium]|nr:T9SS type A sorting domain-containing protein [Bacteroidales bacterium]